FELRTSNFEVPELNWRRANRNGRPRSMPEPALMKHAVSTDNRTSALRVVLIAAAIAVLASPTWLWPGELWVFPPVSVVFTLIVAAIVAAWGRPPPQR